MPPERQAEAALPRTLPNLQDHHLATAVDGKHLWRVRAALTASQRAKNSALIRAAHRGKLAFVKCLLAAGADVHAASSAALKTACEYGHIRVLRALVAAGADVQANDNEPLLLAACTGFQAGVRCLIAAGADVHARNNEALWAAARIGHLPTVQTLVQAGADIHANHDDALLVACDPGHEDVIDYLIARGTYSQSTLGAALREAAFYGHTRIVKKLRLQGASLTHLLPKMLQYSDSVQMAAVSTGNVWRISVAKYAEVLHLEALYVLLARRGHGDLSAMLRATRLLEPLDPSARATVVADLLPRAAKAPTAHAGP